MILPDISHKYHTNRAITLEDIQKWDCFIFLRLTVNNRQKTPQICEDDGLLQILYVPLPRPTVRRKK